MIKYCKECGAKISVQSPSKEYYCGGNACLKKVNKTKKSSKIK